MKSYYRATDHPDLSAGLNLTLHDVEIAADEQPNGINDLVTAGMIDKNRVIAVNKGLLTIITM